MHRRWSLAAAAGLAILPTQADGTSASLRSVIVADHPFAIVGVTVIPMTDGAGTVASRVTRLRNYTVLVRSDRIAAVAPSDSIALPPDVIRVEARGQFVIPGLVDAHVHLLGQAAVNDLPLYLANGVTTVRNMYGEPYHLRWRGEIARGVRIGPTLYTTGPFTDDLTSSRAARAFVRDVRRAGYDAVKVHVPLERSLYDAVIAAAGMEGISVVGHTPGRPMGITAAVHARQRTIEHAESILQSETNEREPVDADIPRIIAALRGSSSCVTPTLVAFDHVIRMTEQYPTLTALLSGTEMRYVRAGLRDAWLPARNEYVTRWRGHETELPQALAKFRRQNAWMRRLVKALAEAGVPLLTGTDASLATVVPGYSLHEELRLLVNAGLSPYAALHAATADAAGCFGHRGDFGVVTPGARADLLLLASDPLVDVAEAAHPLGVVVRGRWFVVDSVRHTLPR